MCSPIAHREVVFCRYSAPSGSPVPDHLEHHHAPAIPPDMPWVTGPRRSWWIEFLPSWNGTIRFVNPSCTPAHDLDLYTDASGTLGCRAYFQGQCSLAASSTPLQVHLHPVAGAVCHPRSCPYMGPPLDWPTDPLPVRQLSHCGGLAVQICQAPTVVVTLPQAIPACSTQPLHHHFPPCTQTGQLSGRCIVPPPIHPLSLSRPTGQSRVNPHPRGPHHPLTVHLLTHASAGSTRATTAQAPDALSNFAAGTGYHHCQPANSPLPTLLPSSANPSHSLPSRYMWQLWHPFTVTRV